MTREELALWTHEAKAVTDLLASIVRAQYAILDELGCPRDPAAVHEILAGQRPAPWPHRNASRDRRRAAHALYALRYAQQVRDYLGPAHENARLAALNALMAGALANDAVINAAIGADVLGKMGKATTAAREARQVGAGARHRELDAVIRDARRKYPSLTDSALAGRLADKLVGTYGMSKRTILRRLKESLPTP